MVSVTRHGAVALVEFGEPGVLTLWDDDLEADLFGALDELGSDDGVRVIGLRGRGRGFCAGADLNVLHDRLDPDTTIDARTSTVLARNVLRVIQIPKPVLAAIDGPCIGIGLAFALSCDIRLASTKAVFGTGFVRRGLVAEHGTAWLLPRIVGLGNALDMLLTGQLVTADRAASMGLVRDVVAAEDLRDKLLALCHELAGATSPRSQALIKSQVYAGLDSTLDEALTMGARLMAETLSAADAREGVESFLKKRPPRFGS